MRRTNATPVNVEGPTVGLVTRIPSNLPDKKAGRALTVASNVRAERGVLSAAPGYEKIIPAQKTLDSPANMIFEAEITNVSPEIRTTPLIGTSGKVFAVFRRAKQLSCVNGQDFPVCQITAALVGDSGYLDTPLANVAGMIVDWAPDLMVHLGDMVYGDSPREIPALSLYEEVVGQFYFSLMGGYVGFYGTGPVSNKFFPVLGNHDWSDAPIAEYYDFFNVPGNERYYSFRRGPAEFFIFSGDPSEPDGVSPSSTQGLWLQAAVAASDTPWRFVCVHFPPHTSDISHYPGRADLEWLAQLSGVSALFCGHAHNMEVIETPGEAPIFICGTGGQALRGFNDPVAANSTFRHSGDFGAMRLTADPSTALVEYFSVGTSTALFSKTLTTPNSVSAGVCYIGESAALPVALEVRPSSASVEQGSPWPFEAWATQRDGNVVDVTTESTWTSDNDGIASVGLHNGIATGKSKGTTTIDAAFGGLEASGSIEVFQTCTDDPIDIMVVVSRAESMNSEASPSTRMQAVKEGLGLLADSLTTQDRVGMVSFAGNFEAQTEDAALDFALSFDRGAFKNAVSLLTGAGGTGMAAGIRQARIALNDSARAGARKVMIIIADRPPDIVRFGDSSSEASAISMAFPVAQGFVDQSQEDDITVVFVGYDIPAAYLDQTKLLAANGYFFNAQSPEELRQTLTGLSFDFCSFGNHFYYYQSQPACMLDVPDIQTLHNWDIVDGVVDLKFLNSPASVTAGFTNREAIDLAGTNAANATGANILEGTMRSKVALHLAPRGDVHTGDFVFDGVSNSGGATGVRYQVGNANYRQMYQLACAFVGNLRTPGTQTVTFSVVLASNPATVIETNTVHIAHNHTFYAPALFFVLPTGTDVKLQIQLSPDAIGDTGVGPYLCQVKFGSIPVDDSVDVVASAVAIQTLVQQGSLIYYPIFTDFFDECFYANL